MSVSDLGSPYISRHNANSARDSEPDYDEEEEPSKWKAIKLPRNLYQNYID